MQPVVKIHAEFAVKSELCSLYDPENTQQRSNSYSTYPCLPMHEDPASVPVMPGIDRDTEEMESLPRKTVSVCYDDESEREPHWTRPWGGNAAYPCDGLSFPWDIFGRFVMLAVIVGFMVINMYICGAFGKTGNWALVFCWLILLCPIYVGLMAVIIASVAHCVDLRRHGEMCAVLIAIVTYFVLFSFGVPYALYTARLRQADRYVDPARVKILSCYRDTFVPDYHINFYHLVDKEWNVSCAKMQFHRERDGGRYHYFYLLPMYYTGKATENCKSPFLLSCYSKGNATCEQLVTTCFNFPPNSITLKTINLNEELWKMFLKDDSIEEAMLYIRKVKPKFTDTIDFHGVPVVYGSDDMDAFDEERVKAEKALEIIMIVGMVFHSFLAILWVIAPEGDALIALLYPFAFCCAVVSECC